MCQLGLLMTDEINHKDFFEAFVSTFPWSQPSKISLNNCSHFFNQTCGLDFKNSLDRILKQKGSPTNQNENYGI